MFEFPNAKGGEQKGLGAGKSAGGGGFAVAVGGAGAAAGTAAVFTRFRFFNALGGYADGEMAAVHKYWLFYEYKN